MTDTKPDLTTQTITIGIVKLEAASNHAITSAVPCSTADGTVLTNEFTARPTLLALGGATFTNQVTLGFTNDAGCVYDALNASATTSISVVPATLNPAGDGFWRNHPELATADSLRVPVRLRARPAPP